MRNLVPRAARTVVVLLPYLAVLAQDAQDVAQRIGAVEQQAQKYLQEQKPQLAIPVLREIVSLDPKSLNGQANLGVLLCSQGNYAEAAPHLRTAMRMQPDLWKIEALLGISEMRTGNVREAQNRLERRIADQNGIFRF